MSVESEANSVTVALSEEVVINNERKFSDGDGEGNLDIHINEKSNDVSVKNLDKNSDLVIDDGDTLPGNIDKPIDGNEEVNKSIFDCDKTLDSLRELNLTSENSSNLVEASDEVNGKVFSEIYNKPLDEKIVKFLSGI